MNGITRRQVLLGLASAPLLHACATPPRSSAQSPAELWSAEGLEAVRSEARSLGVVGIMIVTRGEAVLSDGDVAAPLRVASIRKSLLSALYGNAVVRGQVRLDATLAELGVNDDPPLTELERRATVRQLLQARSGVYLPAAAETEAMRAARPARGSHAPGKHWYYNNWDFNALGAIYQQATGEDVFTALDRELARPLGWQDFDVARHTRWQRDPGVSQFPAYNVMLSTRDLARFGQLFLQRGQWNGHELVPASWVVESTKAYSRTGRRGTRSGYGYMWWRTTSIDGADPDGLPLDSYTAAGNGGRYVTVLPSCETVVAVQPNEQPGKPPVPLYARSGAYDGLLKRLLAAWVG